MSEENSSQIIDIPSVSEIPMQIPDYSFSEKEDIILDYPKNEYPDLIDWKKFVNLHSHTTFSNAIKLDAFGTLGQCLERSKDIKCEYFAVTDHWVISSFYNLIKDAKKAGITPILGCELYVVESLELQDKYRAQKKTKSNKWESDDEALQDAVSKDSLQRFHLVALVENTTWLKNLYKIVSHAWTKGFYYRPSVDWKFLNDHKEGLIFSSACEGWYPISKMKKASYEWKTTEEIIKEGEKALSFMKNIFNHKDDSFFAEIIPIWNSRPQPLLLYKYLYQAAKNLNIPIIWTCDSHYPNKEDSVYQDILLCIWDNKKFYDKDRRKYPKGQFYNRSYGEMFDSMKIDYWDTISDEEISEILNRTYTIAERIKKNKIKLPEAPIVKFPMPKDSPNIYVTFRQLIMEGWTWRNLTKQIKLMAKKESLTQEEYDRNFAEKLQEYKERVEKELDCIMKKGFIDYFLIVRDLIQEARNRDIVVWPWRGCFLPENKVLLENWEEKFISDIKIWDQVISKNLNARKVSHLFEYEINEKIIKLIYWNYENPLSNYMTLTQDHEIMVLDWDNISWKKSQDIKLWDKLLKPLSKINFNKNLNYNSSYSNIIVGDYYISSLNKKLPYSNSLELLYLITRAKDSYLSDIEFKMLPWKIEYTEIINWDKFVIYLTDNNEYELNYNKEGRYFSKIDLLNLMKNDSDFYSAKKDFLKIITKVFEYDFIYKEKEIFENFEILTITKKEEIDYCWKVYDIEVENENSFICNDVVVHNSAAGSLICYLLWITEVDPIPYDLFFERFIDFNRWDTLYSIEHSDYTISDFEKDIEEEERTKIQKDNNWYESLFDDLWNAKEQDPKRFSLIIKEDLNKLLEKEPDLKENKILSNDQIIRESWLITHPINNLSSYAMKLRDKMIKCELKPMEHNYKNSWWLYAIWATAEKPDWDFVCKLTDIPDIDMDFQDNKRDDLIMYLRDKYWHANFAYIATFMEMKGKGTLRDLARIFNIPLQHIESIAKLLIQRSGWDSRASFTLMDTFDQFKDLIWNIIIEYPEIKYAWKLEWQIRQMGMHASGIIVHNDPLYNYWASYTRKGKEIICWDKKASESLWLMKMDVLWLQNLTIIKAACALIKKRTTTEIVPYDIPLDDPKTYEWFKQVKLFWIFQFDWDSASSIARQLKMRNFKEVYDCTALCLATWTDIRMKNWYKKIDDLYKEYSENKKINEKIYSYDFEKNSCIETEIKEIYDMGEQDVFEIELEDWSKIEATENHKFFTNNGWKKVKDLDLTKDILYTNYTF